MYRNSGFPYNPAPERQAERVRQLLQDTIAAGAEWCQIDEELMPTTKRNLIMMNYYVIPIKLQHDGPADEIRQGTIIEFRPGVSHHQALPARRPPPATRNTGTQTWDPLESEASTCNHDRCEGTLDAFDSDSCEIESISIQK